MQPDVRLTVFATCLALTACGGEADTAQPLGSAGGTTAGAGGAGGATAGAGGAGGATAGAGGTAGTTPGAGGASGTTGFGGTAGVAGAAGAGGAAGSAGKDAGGSCYSNNDCQAPEKCIGAVGSCPTGAICILAPRPGTCGIADAGKEAGGSCYSDANCLPTEKCVGAVGSCPDGAICVLPPSLGTCKPKTPVACATKADCQANEVCVQVMFPVYAPRPDATAPSDASSGDVSLPKLGECRPATQAARDPSPSADVWWGAVESALRGT
jgi:hypothetical protein